MRLFKPKNCDPLYEKQKTQSGGLLYVGQSFWYMLTILIYLGCTLMGFGIAYLISKILIEMKIK